MNMYSYIKWGESFKVIFFDFLNFIVLKVNHSSIKWNVAWDGGQTWERNIAYILYPKDKIADISVLFKKSVIAIK